MSWVFGPGSSTPGGADKDIQFNNNGSFSGSNLLITDGSGSLSASVNISASAFYGDGSNLTGLTASAVNVADGPEFSLQFRRDTPVTGEISGSENFSVSSDMTRMLLTGTLIASASTGNPAQFEGLVLVTSPEGELVVRDTTNNKQIRMTADALPTMEFGDITDTDDFFFIQGGATSKIQVDAGLTAFIIATSSAGTGGLVYKPGQERIGIHTPTPTHDFAVNGDTVITGTLNVTGDISASVNISGSGLYVEDAFISSIPADRVLVSTTNGQITSHSPFTFASDVLSAPTITASVGISGSQVQAGSVLVNDVSANGVVVGSTNGQLISHGNFTFASDVLSAPTITASVGISGSQVQAGSVFINDIPANRVLVSTTDGQVTSHSPFTFTSDVLAAPTITASVGIQTEALEVTSSANGSINIGEGIKYTFGGNDRLDVFESEFKLRQVNYFKAVSTVQTVNFNIENFQTFLVDTTGSVITGTLPGLTSDDQIGLTYTIKDFAGSGSTNNIVVEPSGSQEIDSGTSAKIQTNYGALTLTAFSSSHGYSWGIVSAT